MVAWSAVRMVALPTMALASCTDCALSSATLRRKRKTLRAGRNVWGPIRDRPIGVAQGSIQKSGFVVVVISCSGGLCVSDPDHGIGILCRPGVIEQLRGHGLQRALIKPAAASLRLVRQNWNNASG